MTSRDPNLQATEITPRKQRSAGGVARLVVTQGPSTGQALALAQARATVGRHVTNDLVLADPRVSATHLELERRDEGRLFVRDLGTTNGTFLGAHRIFEAELGPSAQVRLGDSALLLELGQPAEPERRSDARRFGGLLGASPEMRELFAALERIAPTSRNVLVLGERGTGKEELARALHAHSPRREGPFVVVDVAHIPARLLESVLFGEANVTPPAEEPSSGRAPASVPDPPAQADRSSSFDPTIRIDHAGAFERAHGGTLFLDEVGEIPLNLQSRLLRVVEDRAVTRVGGSDAVPVDVRLVVASHRDLRTAIDGGGFRADLFDKLAEARVFLPPLRARLADLDLLITHFLDELSTPERRLVMIHEALTSLAERPWPGNVRELRHVVTRAALLSTDGVITEAHLAGEGFGFRGSAAERDPLDLGGIFADAKARAVERFEAAYLEALLRRCGGNLSKASRQADIARNHLRMLLKKRGLYVPADT